MKEEMNMNIKAVLKEMGDYFISVSNNRAEFWEYILTAVINLQEIISNHMPKDLSFSAREGGAIKSADEQIKLH